MSLTRKTGRKQKHFHDPATGKPVVGLSRMTDGRWRIIGTQTRFTEPDARKAIARFHQIMGDKLYEGLPPEEIEWLRTPASAIVDRNVVTAITRGFALVGKAEEAWHRFWAYVGTEIQKRPKWVAEQTGIEEIGYLTDLQPPAPLPSFDEIEKAYMMHAKCSVLQRKKQLRGLKDFIATAEVESLRDISPQTVVAYQDQVHGRTVTRPNGTRGPISGKTQAHLFGGIRRVLRFCKSRGMAVDAINKAVAYLEILKPSETAVTLDPKPIEREDWDKLLAASDGDDRAMILLMLNGAFYLQEVISLEWGDIKSGCIVTHREKTGKCVRVCVLWKETLHALAGMKRHRNGDPLFYTYQGLPIKVCGAQRRFVELALAAGLTAPNAKAKMKPTVTASQLRDGALTAAASANVNSQICSLLAGHRSGIADHYVKRNPKMVAPACEAVYRHYFG